MPDKRDVLNRNNVTVKGNGDKVIVFAHGFGCDQSMWRFVAPSFEDQWKIVLFDFVGSGDSDKNAYDPVRYSDLSGYAADVLEICEALELENVVYVGHSVAALIGILASIQSPAMFEQLVLIGPSPRYINDLPDYIGGFEREDIEGLLGLMASNYKQWSGYLAPVIMGNSDRPALAMELEESFCKVDPEIAGIFARATFLSDYRYVLPKVETPTLIMQCTEDVIAPLEVGAYMHQKIRGSSFRMMEATGHCPHVSHPDETIALISEYLREVYAGIDKVAGA
ncbi:Pimeloyl-ACP methyl ester carboxylesterase [Cohnella sp. OV330]|uniref:alpha/beta fold hydrolase n=1 Tax=Cohnella sp. OV330 TaxID=1855288 RepID=UPI0008EA3C40|nr:alpha/beta hydrolase [Cohnella sp. OV330]SFB30742.1 Pimeloyl-ACP methyl ester carboxylesterase [Cohnella sp. OV330]